MFLLRAQESTFLSNFAYNVINPVLIYKPLYKHVIYYVFHFTISPTSINTRSSFTRLHLTGQPITSTCTLNVHCTPIKYVLNTSVGHTAFYSLAESHF